MTVVAEQAGNTAGVASFVGGAPRALAELGGYRVVVGIDETRLVVGRF